MEIDIAGKATNLSGFQEHNYQLEAIPHVFKTLYSSMYENKEQVVLSELAANGLDAQVQNGTADVPVKIVLPDPLSPELVVTDCGVGMSKETLEELYTVYGASSKRDDNIGIGGFGFGSKSPFSIADSFTVVSTHEGITTHVANYLDNGMPKFVVMDSSYTGEPSGTTVRVPVADEKIQSRLRTIAGYLYVCWAVHPEIGTGGRPLYGNVDHIVHYRAENYTILDRNSHDPRYGAYLYGTSFPLEVVQVGPFLYNIPEAMKNHWSATRLEGADEDYDFLTVLSRRMSGRMALHFEIGALELSPTRERIEDTTANREAVLKRIAEVRKYVQSVTPEWNVDTAVEWLEYAKDFVKLRDDGGYLYFDKAVVPEYFNSKHEFEMDDPVLLAWLAHNEGSLHISDDAEASERIWDAVKSLNSEEYQEFIPNWASRWGYVGPYQMPARQFLDSGFVLSPYSAYNERRTIGDKAYKVCEILSVLPIRGRSKKQTANNITYPPFSLSDGSHIFEADAFVITPDRLWPLFGPCMELEQPADGDILYLVDSVYLQEALRHLQEVLGELHIISQDELEVHYKEQHSRLRSTRRAPRERRVLAEFDTRIIGRYVTFNPTPVTDDLRGRAYKEEKAHKLLVVANSEQDGDYQVEDFVALYDNFAKDVLVVYLTSSEIRTRRLQRWAESFDEYVVLGSNNRRYVQEQMRGTKLFEARSQEAKEYAIAVSRLSGAASSITTKLFQAYQYIIGKPAPCSMAGLHGVYSEGFDDHHSRTTDFAALPIKLRVFLDAWRSLGYSSHFHSHEGGEEDINSVLLKKDINELRNYALQLGNYRPKAVEDAA